MRIFALEKIILQEEYMNSVKIIGTGSYVPRRVVTNDEMRQFIDTNDEWISSRTGIKTRHVSTGETTWQMAVASAEEALDNANLSAKNIQAIISTTGTPDYYYPSLSCLISSKLGTHRPLAIDVSCACAGFVYGLDLARRYLMDEEIENVLLVSSEVLSKQVDYSDRSSCVLFGDAAAALVLTKDQGIFHSYLKSDSGAMKSISCKAHGVSSPWVQAEHFDDFDGLLSQKESPLIFMAGQEVFKFATKIIPESLIEVCNKAGCSPNELDLIIPHQANLRIIESSMKRLNINMTKVLHNIENYGNTSSASIPLCIHEGIQSGKIQSGQKIGLVGFGGGLSYASCMFEFL